MENPNYPNDDNSSPPTPNMKTTFQQLFTAHRQTLECDKGKRQGTVNMVATGLRHTKYTCDHCHSSTTERIIQQQKQLKTQKQKKQAPIAALPPQQEQQHLPDTDMEMTSINQALENFEHHPDLPDYMKLIMTQLTSMNKTINDLKQQLHDGDQTIAELQQSVATLTTSSPSTPQVSLLY